MISDSKAAGDRILLPLIPLRGLMAYPNMMLKIDVGRDKSIAAVEQAMAEDKRVVLVAQKDSATEDVQLGDVYGVGTVARIKQVIKLPDDTLRMIVEGESRALVMDLRESGMVQLCDVKLMGADPSEDEKRLRVLSRAVKKVFLSYARERGDISAELIGAVEGAQDPALLCDLVAANSLSEMGMRQAILETRSLSVRLEGLLTMLDQEKQLSALMKRVIERTQINLDKHQKEYFIGEQIRVLRQELGDDEESELDEYREKLGKSAMPDAAREKAERELRRMEHATLSTPEGAMSRNYVEALLELPWGVYSKDALDLKRARRVLDKDHYGLERVKKRILEHLAVRKLSGGAQGSILCLIGPPGVGKTSIARSVARAMNRKFVRLSLGGVRDEAEIRGFRRSYVGAIPGRIAGAIRDAGSMNPVFLLDEIDKLASDFRGDPASALLEALDPAQNGSFSDHYLEAPLDLSKVFFITTANSRDTIPAPLLDRMELIEIEGYTRPEKTEIALRHLWPRALKAHGLDKSRLRLTREAVQAIIDGYTREAGVRALDQKLSAICRHAALRILEEESAGAIRIAPENLKEFLGARKYLDEEAEKAPAVGLVNGLAWTEVGGVLLPVEALALPGAGEIQLTGNLGEVMKESARAALSCLRARANDYGLEPQYFKEHEMHLHAPEGATPKDGPSAGVAIACAFLSAATGRPVRQDAALTGEITLRGRVLPIGGVKEKLLAARRAGLRLVLIPRENEKDLEELDADCRAGLDIRFMEDAKDAFDILIT